MNFEDIQSLEDLAVVSEEVVWQNFERLAAFIFEKNNFRVKVNTVKTHNKTKRQYDVIALKGNQTFLVECKKWAGNRYRLSAMKKAVEQHKERTRFYAAITHEDAIPLLVTLIEEEIRVYEGVPIVPVQKLNQFVNELDVFKQGNFFCECEDEIAYDDAMSYEYNRPYDDDLPLPETPVIRNSTILIQRGALASVWTGIDNVPQEIIERPSAISEPDPCRDRIVQDLCHEKRGITVSGSRSVQRPALSGQSRLLLRSGCRCRR